MSNYANYTTGFVPIGRWYCPKCDRNIMGAAKDIAAPLLHSCGRKAFPIPFFS